ncbi:diguanylate cyclase domain-containing protein [Mycobacterium sp. DL592]|uniref:diguanylate cyclase domain-containing protein n=1 Tax=Mycobacterium sp. DL592 TaxID=2675524 RepID=UPI001421665B|nr:diguanylate cyclase [Mycobacterium sp. DL592]
MDRAVRTAEDRLNRWARVAAAAVLVAALLDLSGWVSHIDELKSFTPAWLAGLAAAVLLQTGRPSRQRVWFGRALAVAIGASAAVVLVEHLAGHPFGPTPRTAASMLYLSVAVVVMRLDRRRTGLPWGTFLLAAMAAPVATVMGHLFRLISAVRMTESTGQGITTAIGVLLLVAATVLARPDRNPSAWLLARRDRWALLRLIGVLAGLPLVVSLARLPFLELGLGSEAAWILATTISTTIVGVVAFYFSQREQHLLIERANAERRYHILADNAVDVVFHLHGGQVTWVSPSVQAAFGDPPAQWTGSDLTDRIDPEDLPAVTTAVGEMRTDAIGSARFRVRTAGGGYHWVDGNAKPYLDEDGNTDGMIAALRIVDDKVEAERRLDRLARFDILTGLPNRAEVIGRLESTLDQPRSPGSQLGILFCDVDHFKTINDTLGHAAGDVVLSTLAARISESVRIGDTVGRMGGDEIVVLLPGVHSLDETAQIAENIRCRAAEPIEINGETVSATLSIGATVSAPGESASAVTARADAAMYQAKQARRNSVVRI